MTESQMQTFFRDYLEKNPPNETEVYELKIAKTTSIAFDKVQPHQIEALLKAQDSHLFHKITDPPVFYNSPTRFNVKRPFDCMVINKAKAFVVIWFYKPRQKKVFIKIPIAKFIEMRNNANRKSFTEAMAVEVGELLTL